MAFVLVCWSLAIATVREFYQSAGAGVAILAVGAVVYFFWPGRKVDLPPKAG